MVIPFVDLHKQYKSIKKAVDPALKNVLMHSQFIQGNEVEEFENNFSRYLQANHCISVNSGTDALLLGLKALNLKIGSEVILPVNTFIATANAVVLNGLKPVFVDIDQNYGISLKDLQTKITHKTAAIIVVHLYGQPDKLNQIKKVIKDTRQHIFLIEDACQAHGAEYIDKKIGTFGIFSAFSFYPGKNLGAYGDAGAIVTNNEKLAEKVKLLRNHGQKIKYKHEIVAFNSRMDTLQAVVLNVKLQYLDQWNKQRRELAQKYTEKINTLFPFIQTPSDIVERKSVFHLYVIQTNKRNQLLSYLQKRGIATQIHYPVPLHFQKAYHYLGYSKGDFPMAEFAAKRIISLPIFPELTKRQIDYVIQAMTEFYQ